MAHSVSPKANSVSIIFTVDEAASREKTVELAVDFRRQQQPHDLPAPLTDLAWRSRQHLQQPRKSGVSTHMLVTFYGKATGSILSRNITSWFANGCAQDTVSPQSVEGRSNLLWTSLGETSTPGCARPEALGSRKSHLSLATARSEVMQPTRETQEVILPTCHESSEQGLNLTDVGPCKLTRRHVTASCCDR